MDFSPWSGFSLHRAKFAFYSFPLWFQFCSPGPHRTQPTPTPWALQGPDHSGHAFTYLLFSSATVSSHSAFHTPKSLGLFSCWLPQLDTHQYIWSVFKLWGPTWIYSRRPVTSLVLPAMPLLIKPTRAFILSIYTIS